MAQDTDGGDVAGADQARLAYEDLATLDLDEHEGRSLEQIGAILRDLANRASAAQLHAFLDGPETLPSETDGKQEMVERYVARRLRTVAELRRLRDAFRFGETA